MVKKDEKPKKEKTESFMGPWPGPPGCTCDLMRPAKDRCTKGGWMRCKGSYDAMLAQYAYRRRVGPKGGSEESRAGGDPLKLRGQKVKLQIRHGKLRFGDICTIVGSCLGKCSHRAYEGRFVHVRRDDGEELNHLTLAYEEVALTLPRVEEGGTLTDDCRVPLILKKIGGGDDVLFGEMVVMHNTAWVEVANNSRLLWDRPSMTMEGVYKKGDLITLRIEYFPLLQCEIFVDEKKET